MKMMKLILIMCFIQLYSSSICAQKTDSHTNWGNLYLQMAQGSNDKQKQIELYTKAISRYNNGIKKGSADAYNGLGSVYYYAPNPMRNLELSFQYFTKAKELGSKLPEYNLSRFYLAGLNVVDPDNEKAISLLMEGLEKQPERSSIFYRELGLIYELGIGTEIDYNKALDYYKKTNPDDKFPNLYYLQYELNSILKGTYNDSISIFYRFGMLKTLTEEYDQAYISYHVGAQLGHAICQRELAYLLRDGLGCQKNEIEAFNWLMKSANNGFSLAQNGLGLFYLNGIGTTKDNEQSFYWTKESAQNGNIIAQNNLGYYYKNATGTVLNYEKAYYWFNMAFENGMKSAEKEMKSVTRQSKLEKIEKVLTTLTTIDGTLVQYNNMEKKPQTYAISPNGFESIFNQGGSDSNISESNYDKFFKLKQKSTIDMVPGQSYISKKYFLDDRKKTLESQLKDAKKEYDQTNTDYNTSISWKIDRLTNEKNEIEMKLIDLEHMKQRGEIQ